MWEKDSPNADCFEVSRLSPPVGLLELQFSLHTGLRSVGKTGLWSRKWDCCVFCAYCLPPKVSFLNIIPDSLGSMWLQETQRMTFLVPRCPVPGTDAGVRTWHGEALKDPVPNLCCLWILHNYKSMLLDCICKHQGRGWSGGKNAYDLVVTHSAAHPSRTTSPYPATHPRTSSPILSSVTTKTLLCITVQDVHSEGTSVWVKA
jgi:hypothetical protein